MTTPIPIIVVSLGLPIVNSERVHQNSVPETISVFDSRSGGKIHSHRLEGQGSGLAINSSYILSSRAGKSSSACFVWGKEAPNTRFAAPEQLGPITFTNDGIHVIAGGESGTIYIWEVYSGQLLCAWKAHYRKVQSLKVTCDDGILITGSDDAIVHLWDLSMAIMNESNPEISLLKTVSKHKTGITGIACSIIGNGINSLIATCSLDHTCRIFLTNSNVELFVSTFPVSLLCIALEVEEKLVFCGGMDGIIYCGEIQTNKTFSLTGHEASVTCLQTTILKNYTSVLFSGSNDGTIKSWDILSRSPLKTIRMDGATPVRFMEIIEIDFTQASKTGSKTQQLSLKKLKESEQDDRWITATSQSVWAQNNSVINLEETGLNSSISSSSSSSSKPTDLEQKWSSIANRLYAIATENVLNRISGEKTE